ncbi:phosphate starvation-inducible protein PhoH [Treponema bryantii]|uniref:PhoH-like protein n=1 Tax=Treponema bryantii TaxID=163 RepID=A0A1H9AAC1_9SPIR|nr:PhoH family protein [Treponema bryantii]BDC93754.1 phosphate starvation protein PhoH [Treponema bryantii]SEP73383.1 phosphate starvation-inducible protein PhoH [Treponema bryantii]
MNEYTIVVPDNDVLSCVCGTNDKNLQLIEEHLGVPVFSKGNELSVENAAPEICQKFQFIVDRIVDEVQSGGKNSDDIILSVLNTKRKVDADEMVIMVPGAVRRVYPRTQGQAEYVDLLQNRDMVFCTGSAGSGKTYLAVAEALRLILTHKKTKLIITRPVVEAGESLGFLPGDLEDKIDPYLRPLRDAMETILPPESVKRLFEAGIVEVAPLAYMRGRTLNNAVVILDEAQNTTCAQMKMFLTRMGENTKVFVTGDPSQIDLPKKVTSGLMHSISILNKIEDIGFMELTADDVVRNPLVKKIVKAYENEKEQF